MEAEWKRHVEVASARAEVREAVVNLYSAVQREIDARRPLCVVSGRCCRFEEYGHRLFVTTMELATFFHELQASAVGRRGGGGGGGGGGGALLGGKNFEGA